MVDHVPVEDGHRQVDETREQDDHEAQEHAGPHRERFRPDMPDRRRDQGIPAALQVHSQLVMV